MRKPKATVKSLREELKNLQAQFDVYREKTRAYIFESSSISNVRGLMTVEPANNKGLINGLTIPELVLMVNLLEGTGEIAVLSTSYDKKNLTISAKKKGPRTPVELL
jgi:hypothetical protein